MKKICAVFFGLFLCVNQINAATVRDQKTASRSDSQNITTRQTATKNTNRSVTSRAAKKTATRTSVKNVSARSATIPNSTARAAANIRKSRAASTVKTKTFGDNYNACRDAYFTCMDQFCALQNDDYRRCVCSSKLKDIKEQEQKLSQANASLQDFQDFNINAISKTAAEVSAMVSASAGEQAIKQDTSASANTLNNISSVLNSTKQKSLSTSGTLDIGGDIKAIWSTTDLIGGSDIVNLTGEALYNAVHAQCAEMASENCSASNLKMVSSAYGMYIENDCALLESSIAAKMTAANASIRTTRHNMQDARYDNYNAHNSLSLNDCVAKVRQDLTANTACGQNYIHCLDVTGKYLNITTGEPIYSPEFYQIANQISLSGDVLKNKTNTPFVNVLNSKRAFAKSTLELCTDNADDVWNEFLQQAIVEIYQGQQARVQSVKDECLQVVNTCYGSQTEQLKSFSDSSDKIMLGQTLEVAEDMCSEKLTACSNLYGGGPEGLTLLQETMFKITDNTIAQSCRELLTAYAKNVCAVSANDSGHSYPYGCRALAPGESKYARTPLCNTTLANPFENTDTTISFADITSAITTNEIYSCLISDDYIKVYTSCEFNHYLYGASACSTENPTCFSTSINATECRVCPVGFICPGGTDKPRGIAEDLYNSCGVHYVGSLYQKMVRYALQNCTRPSSTENVLPETILADVDITMKEVQTALSKELASECDKQNGVWVDIQWVDENADGIHDRTGDLLLHSFYETTGSHKLWGYCKAE